MKTIKLLIFFFLIANIFFGKMSFAQVYDYPQGCIFDKDDYRNVLQRIPLTRGSSQPPVRSSLKQYCPFVGIQSYQDCTAWACSYSAFTILEAANKSWTNRKLITDFSYSVSFVFNQVKDTEDCNTLGISIESTLELLKEVGCTRQAEFGYGCEKLIKANDLDIAQYHKISNYYSLSNGNNNDFNLIKKALVEKKPVIVAVDSYESFADSSKGKRFWNGEMDYKRGVHALTIIGYDDNSQSFELMNSWGKDWGDDGFIQVKYEHLKNILLAAYTITYPQSEISRPSNHSAFSGSIKLEDRNGQPILIRSKNDHLFEIVNQMSSGDGFRLVVQNDQPVYLYVLSSDLSNNDQLLIPLDDKNNAHIPFSNTEIIFPDFNQCIELDKTIGKDYLCVILSKHPILLPSFMTRLGRQSGLITERLEYIMDNKYSGCFMQLSGNETRAQIDFNGNNNENEIVAIIEIEHND